MDHQPVTDAQTAPATCYRHPDRPTRLSCTSCAKPICVDCTRQAAVGQKCPDCAAPNGRSKVVTAAQIRNRSKLDGSPVVKGILGVTVAIAALRFVAPAAWAVIAGLTIDDVAAVNAGQLWRTFTAALLHSASLYHVGFNMYALYVFGPDLERRFGSLPFLLFYVATAAGGGAAFQLTNDAGSALGASGAVFGLFGAYVLSAYLARHTAAGRAGLNQLLPLLAINLALPLLIPNIAWQAHLGGMLFGALIMLAWRQIGTTSGGFATDRTAGVALQRSAIAGGALVLALVIAALA